MAAMNYESDSSPSETPFAILDAENGNITELVVRSDNEDEIANEASRAEQERQQRFSVDWFQAMRAQAAKMNHEFDSRRHAVFKQAMHTLSAIGHAIELRNKLPDCEAKEILSGKVFWVLDAYIRILKVNEPKYDTNQRYGDLEDLDALLSVLEQLHKSVSAFHVLLETVRICPPEMLPALSKEVKLNKDVGMEGSFE